MLIATEPPPVATVRITSFDARGERHYVDVAVTPELRAALDTYDRWARRRAARWRRQHVLSTDLRAQRQTRPRKDAHTAARCRLVGYLNYELEPASAVAGLAVQTGAPWEGTRIVFRWLIGEGPTWDGPAAWVTTTTVVLRAEGKVAETSTYGIEAVSPAECRRCRGLAKLPRYAVCLDCCRSGRDREIGTAPTDR